MGRYDLIQAFASRVTKWNRLCDKKPHRLVLYIQPTLDLRLYGWVGASPDMTPVCLVGPRSTWIEGHPVLVLLNLG